MSAPVFTTSIALDGPQGNIFVVWGRAAHMLKELGRKNDADILSTQVQGAKSYEQALRFIRHWFPLTLDGEDYEP